MAENMDIVNGASAETLPGGLDGGDNLGARVVGRGSDSTAAGSDGGRLDGADVTRLPPGAALEMIAVGTTRMVLEETQPGSNGGGLRLVFKLSYIEFQLE
jgi:hypothetical protein